MSISELSVRRPVTISMVYILICVVALVYIGNLSIALHPTTSRPVVTVTTSYGNVGAEIVDQNVTKPLSTRLSSVSGVKKITSVSISGSSTIRVEFGYDADMEKALSDVQSIAASAQRGFPDEVDAPVAKKFDGSASPFMKLALYGALPSDKLRTIAEDTVQPFLERIDGVASTTINGGRQKQIKIDVDLNSLYAYHLTISNIISALSATNIQSPGGEITEGEKSYQLMTDAYYTSLDDIKNTIIKTYSDGTTLRLENVAKVYEGANENGKKVFINGEEGLYISTLNESDANITKIADEVKKALPDINSKLPKGTTLEIISDNTTMIKSSMGQVYDSAIQGIILAMIVVFLFMRSIKSSFIIGLAIPISILITLMAMSAMGLSVNIMTMSGLILALGMTVDSSIVILENIQNFRLKGESAFNSAILGSRNMLTAIVASTLTTLCVFVPMLIFKAKLEAFGQMFYELIVTVCIALVASLFVAVTLVPALSGSILKLDTRTQKPIKNFLFLKCDNSIEKILVKGENGYKKCIAWCLKNKFLVVTFSVTLVIFSITLLSTIGMNLTPKATADDQVTIDLRMRVGTDKDVVLKRLFEVQDLINETV